MKKRRKSPARLVAVIALIGAAVAIGAVVSGATDEDSASRTEYGKSEKAQKKPRTTASFYVVENGDTLIAIAHKTRIPIGELEELNPEVDPQLLNAGEKLKLK
jgi:LysM repeat protein